MLNREIIEQRSGTRLTEQQWAAIVEEIEGRVDNFFEEILDGVIEDIKEQTANE